jgi:hypothetical protein
VRCQNKETIYETTDSVHHYRGVADGVGFGRHVMHHAQERVGHDHVVHQQQRHDDVPELSVWQRCQNRLQLKTV